MSDYPDVRENILLVGTKFDLVESKDDETKKKLLEARINACKDNNLAGSIFSSALTRDGVKEAFMTIARQSLINLISKSSPPSSNQKKNREYDEVMSLYYLQQDTLALTTNDIDTSNKFSPQKQQQEQKQKQNGEICGSGCNDF